MRLVTVVTPTGTAVAVETAGGRRVVADAGGRPHRDVGDLLRSHADWRALAERAAHGGERLGDDLALARPVLEPGAVVCVGMNYRKHVAEMGRAAPDVPTYFSKLARALTDPDTAVALPAASQCVDYEGELAVVVGRGGRGIAADRAWDAVAGLTLMNDVSMRDFQRRSPQWFAGKSWEACTPLGPAVVTRDELPDLAQREIVTRVNGDERQRAPLAEMIFDVPALIADLSRIFTLRPGDVIATGTPSGVGDATKPPRYLRPGDIVEVALDGIGVLRNTFTGGRPLA